MENQVNAGDQNAQQVGQNPINQPSSISGKPIINYWMISTIILILISILLSLYAYKLWSAQNLNSQQSIQITPTPTSSVTSVPTADTDVKEFKTYDSKFITFRYPASLYVWSFGRGVNLGYFQINSVDSDNQNSPNRASISVDIHVPQYRPEQTLEEVRQSIYKNQEAYPSMNYTMTDRKIDGQNALVIETTGNTVPTPQNFYTKNVWVWKNNVVYEIDLNIEGETLEMRDSLRNQYNPVFENILSSVKLKYVDPVEVEQLGNHPD